MHDGTPSNHSDPESDDFFADEIERPPPGPLDGRPAYAGLLSVALCYLVIVCLSGYYWNDPEARVLAVSFESAVNHGKWWQLFSALTVHSGFLHLLSNTPMFLVFGFLLHGYFGRLIFPVLCVALGAGANLLTILNMPGSQRLVGMSGMIYAMVALWMTFYMRFETNYRWPVRIVRASAVSLVLMFPTTYSPTTSYQAHAWGFLLGIIAGIIVGRFIKPQSIAV